MTKANTFIFFFFYICNYSVASFFDLFLGLGQCQGGALPCRGSGGNHASCLALNFSVPSWLWLSWILLSLRLFHIGWLSGAQDVSWSGSAWQLHGWDEIKIADTNLLITKSYQLYIYLLAITCKCTSCTLNVRFRCKVYLSCILFHSCTEREPWLHSIKWQTDSHTSLFIHTVKEFEGPITLLTFSDNML